jgi:hypothetical protein
MPGARPVIAVPHAFQSKVAAGAKAVIAVATRDSWSRTRFDGSEGGGEF